MRGILLVVLAGVAFTACDLPTALPSWDVDVQTPAITDTISLASVLPPQVQVREGAFVLPSWTVNDSISMGDVCGLCESMAAAVPAASMTRDMQLPLPGGLVSASLEEATVDVTVEHTLPFPLLRSSTGATGQVVVEVRDSLGAVLARATIDGASEPLPTGKSSGLQIHLGQFTITGPVTAHLAIQIPGSGSPVRLQPDMRVKVSATLHDVKLSRMTVLQSGISQEGSIVKMDLGHEIRDELLARARGAHLIGTVEYPLDDVADASVAILASPTESAGPDALGLALQLKKGSNPFDMAIDSAQLAHLLSGDAIYAHYRGTLRPGTVTLEPNAVLVYHLTLAASMQVGPTP